MKPIPEVVIHPISAKLIGTGHCWITEDSFTQKFPKNEDFLVGKQAGKKVCIFLHDPHHKTIKGRVWTTKETFSFTTDLEERFKIALEKRKALNLARENYYLIFGEADELPGLFIQNLSDRILLQYFTSFWHKHTKTLVALLKKYHSGINAVWLQERGIGVQKPASLIEGNKEETFTLKEFDANYKIVLGKAYDHGLYTDMASLRHKLGAEFFTEKNILNLYSYTGAFSVFALKAKAKNVVSVDLSKQYLDWLGENIALNSDLDASLHQSMNMSVQDAFKKLSKTEQRFDVIVCDPPSASSDGKKTTSSLQEYENLIEPLYQLLNRQGKLVLFLNTHHVAMSKFEAKIKAILKDKQLDKSLKFNSHLSLGEDCPTKKGFPEGSYLKGLLFTKV